MDPSRTRDEALTQVHSSLLTLSNSRKPLSEAGEDLLFLFTFAGHACREGLDSIAEMPFYDLGKAYQIAARRFPDSPLTLTLARLLEAVECTPESFASKVRKALDDDDVRIPLAYALYGASAMMDPPIWDQIWNQLGQWALDAPDEIVPG